MDDYLQFLAERTQTGTRDGFRPTFFPPAMKDFQCALTEWAVEMGRAALLEDCGLGKTIQQLTWAENVVRHTNGRVLVMAPLAVTEQTVREAEKFGIEVHNCRDGIPRPGVNITNYERLHLFDANDYVGAVCDESSILKSFDGQRRQDITAFMRKMRYRLLCTATAAPNEYTELGTSSEALGYLGYMDMLSRFFKNNQGNSIKPNVIRHRGKNFQQLDDNAKWRFKGHAEGPFWRWVCSWARAVRRPSDIGFADDGFILPPLIEYQHQVAVDRPPSGMLFTLPAVGLAEQRDERRRTIRDRCEKAASLVTDTGQPAVVWCQLNDEGDILEDMIRDCVQVSGKDSDDAKVEKFNAFLDGEARVLVTKGRIGAWGMNFQHCAHSVSFPTHSFEEYYQGIRRFYRFGQTRSVVSDIVTTEGEKSILANLQRKALAADKMFNDLVAYMNDAIAVDRSIEFTKNEELPAWL